MKDSAIIDVEKVGRSIYEIRGKKVMMDIDLALLYCIKTSNLNKAVKRNMDRFPADFMFQLNDAEWKNLIFQNGISSTKKWGGRRTLPYVFTEHGILMLSSVLRSKRAIQVNIAIMRTFVELRKMILSYSDLCRRIDALEARYDDQFRAVFDAIRSLMAPEPIIDNKRKIGFRLE